MDLSQSDRDPVEVLADEFLQRRRRGESPKIAEYVERYPEHAREIRDLFPALVALEHAGPANASAPLASDQPDQSLPETIGDYRIHREIGRGAMGVVYEAEQQSLDRRVALKVLPWHALGDAVAVERFRREAKAAARLHHSNIVPVFEVGSHEDLCFYAMQLIQGQSLEKVIYELRRMRQAGATPSEPLPTQSLGAPSVRSLAMSLYADGFRPVGGSVASPDEVPTQAIPAPKLNVAAAETIRLQPADTKPIHLNPIPRTSTQATHYFRSVARIGQQAAEALAYAHSRGVIHRDIKPSNLMLDAAGVVWMADFGLAKTEDDSITRSGDLLGTLRYMAPERFRGQCQATADIYALGVTLYELLVLRAPFDSADGPALIDQITKSEPPSLASLDPTIPKDLETIVAKCLDRDPLHRYATADAVAEDLRRFVGDEPILARQLPLAERFARWSRRNRTLALSMGSIAALLILAVIISSVASASFQSLAQKEKQARVNTTSNLYQSLLHEAEATRLTRREGYREKVWSLLDEARQLDSPAVDVTQLRREAVQATGDFAGLIPTTISGLAADITAIVLSADSQTLAIGLANGSIRWHDSRSGDLLSEQAGSAKLVALRFSQQTGELISADAHGVVKSWKRDGDGKWTPTVLKALGAQVMALVVDTQDRIVAAYQPSGLYAPIHIVDLRSQQTTSVTPRQNLRSVSLSSDGTMLAGVSAEDIFVWNTRTGELIERTYANLGTLLSASFARDNKSLLCTCDQGIAIFDLPNLKQQTFMRIDHVPAGAFNPDGSQAAFADSARQVMLWSFSSNREVAALTHPGTQSIHSVAFSGDSKLLASADSQSVRVWNLAGPSERVTLAGHRASVIASCFAEEGARLLTAAKDHSLSLWIAENASRIATLGFAESIDAVAANDALHLAVVGGIQNLQVVDTYSLRSLAKLPHSLGKVAAIRIAPDGKKFAACGEDGIALFAISGSHESKDVTIEKALQVSQASAHSLSMSSDGQLIAWIDRERRVRLFDLAERVEWSLSCPRVSGGQHTLAFAGNQHILLVNQEGQMLEWDAITDRQISKFDLKDARVNQLAAVAGYVAIEAEPLTVSILNLNSRERLFAFRQEQAGISSMNWSGDGRRLAVGLRDGGLAIWDLRELRTKLATVKLDWEEGPAPKANVNRAPLEALNAAIKESPEDLALAHRRAVILSRLGRSDAAMTDLDKLVGQEHDDAHSARAVVNARLGKWNEAAADALKAATLDRDSFENAVNAAILLARAGDSEKYHAHCADMKKRFQEVSPEQLERLATASLLLPGTSAKDLPLSRLETALLPGSSIQLSSGKIHTLLALAAYRAKDLDRVAAEIRKAQEDPEYSRSPRLQALSFVILAMVEKEVGKPRIAPESLTAAKQFAGADAWQAASGEIAAERIVFNVLYAEAAKLILNQ